MMKRFLMATAAAAFTLSSPLAMAQQGPGNPPGKHDNHPAGSPAAPHDNHPNGAPAQHDTHVNNEHATAPGVAKHDTTINHNTTVINDNRPGGPGFGGGGGWTGHSAGPGPQIENGHSWRNGERYTGSREVVTNWSDYHVQRPPAGYEYVRDGNQLVLIAVASGIIASVLANSGY
jgi:Ni/Co efflux regulator RcnB